MSYLVAPNQRLPVQIGELAEVTRREESMTNSLNGACDAALLIAAPHLARSRGELVMRAAVRAGADETESRRRCAS